MTKNAWILVNRYCLTFNIYRPFLVDSSDFYNKLSIGLCQIVNILYLCTQYCFAH